MKKLLLALVLVLFMATGCEQFQNKQLMDRIDKLEKQVAMLKAGGTGASFYPVSGGFDENTSGNLDNIGSTAASDAAFVVLAENSMWGYAWFPFALDAAGGLSQAIPYVVDAKDGGNEDWNWVPVYGRKLFGHMHVITDADGCTIGVDCDTEEATNIRVAWGGIVMLTGTGTVKLPVISDDATPTATEVEIGASICIITKDNNEVLTVDPGDTDSITLAGTKDSAGDSIKTTVTAGTGAGDFVCLVAVEADNWMVMGYKGTWSPN